MNASTEAELVVALQAGLPLVARPFAALGAEHGVDEGTALDLVRALLADGRARRFGGIFDNARLGARSALCAVRAGAAADAIAARVVAQPGVTHCYLRDGDPDLWFTLTALPEDYAAQLKAIAVEGTVLELPTRRRFKLGVVLPPAQEAVAGPAAGAAAGDDGPATGAVTLFPAERRLVDRLQDHLEPTARPFTVLGDDAGGEDAVLERLRRWQEAGILRRVALVCRHRRLGYHGNVMAVWDLPDDAVVAAGRRLAEEACVSHCYERVRLPAFPYRLYAMIHRPDLEEARTTAARLGEAIGYPPGRVLATVKEYKKTSPRPFAEVPA